MHEDYRKAIEMQDRVRLASISSLACISSLASIEP
jgi:hypothetical protein